MNERRGAQKKKSGGFIFILALLLAIAIAVVSLTELLKYYRSYRAGEEEYRQLQEEYQNKGDGLAAENNPDIQIKGSAESGPEIIENIEALDDPQKREDIISASVKYEAVENGRQVSLPKLKNPVDLSSLYQQNQDLAGWIYAGAVGISYPVVQGEDNDYYLHHTFRREENPAGCIFIGSDYSKDMTDQNTVIYGHNMKDLSMFGRLKEYADQAVYERNHYFWIYTDDFIYQYEIFSCSVAGSTGEPYLRTFTEEAFGKVIEHSLERSEISCSAKSPGQEDRIVTLYTCTNDSSSRRILQGVLVQVYIAA